MPIPISLQMLYLWGFFIYQLTILSLHIQSKTKRDKLIKEIYFGEWKYWKRWKCFCRIYVYRNGNWLFHEQLPCRHVYRNGVGVFSQSITNNKWITSPPMAPRLIILLLIVGCVFGKKGEPKLKEGNCILYWSEIHEPSSTVAAALKFDASESVQPKHQEYKILHMYYM